VIDHLDRNATLDRFGERARSIAVQRRPRLRVDFSPQGCLQRSQPPPETGSNLADFHRRQGHAPRFAGKGREMAPVYAGRGRYEGRSAGRLRASSQGVEG
jgi:hypothetical protein